MKKLRIFLIALLGLAASSAMSQEVRFNFDVTADFSKFKTYRWVPIEGATQAQGLTEEQVTGAFDAELTNKGLTKVASRTADLFIGYQFGVKKEQDFGGYNTDWGYGNGFETDTWQGGSATDLPTKTFFLGELTLDIYAVSNHTLLWRGVASKTVDLNAKPNTREKHLVKAVKKLMEYYPPAAVVR